MIFLPCASFQRRATQAENIGTNYYSVFCNNQNPLRNIERCFLPVTDEINARVNHHNGNQLHIRANIKNYAVNEYITTFPNNIPMHYAKRLKTFLLAHTRVYRIDPGPGYKVWVSAVISLLRTNIPPVSIGKKERERKAKRLIGAFENRRMVYSRRLGKYFQTKLIGGK